MAHDDAECKKALKDVFDGFDTDKSGSVDAKEFGNVLVKYNELLDAKNKISDADIKKASADFISKADKNADGKVNFDEFYAFVCPALKK